MRYAIFLNYTLNICLALSDKFTYGYGESRKRIKCELLVRRCIFDEFIETRGAIIIEHAPFALLMIIQDTII
jgi:hypothetical protein